MKVTCKIVILFINIFPACEQAQPLDEISIQQAMDSIASVKIDSAYKQIQRECDIAIKYRVPILVDSLLHADSLK